MALQKPLPRYWEPKDRGSTASLLRTFASPRGKPRARGLLRRSKQHRSAFAYLATYPVNPPETDRRTVNFRDEAAENDSQEAERSHSEWSEMHWHDLLRQVRGKNSNFPHTICGLRWDRMRSSSRPDALVHPLGDVGLNQTTEFAPMEICLGKVPFLIIGRWWGIDADATDDL